MTEIFVHRRYCCIAPYLSGRPGPSGWSFLVKFPGIYKIDIENLVTWFQIGESNPVSSGYEPDMVFRATHLGYFQGTICFL